MPIQALDQQSSHPPHILHILDHSLPLHSGYTFRTLAILRQQRTLGWRTTQLTGTRQGPLQSGPAHKPEPEHIDGWEFHRTAPDGPAWMRLPVLRQLGAIQSLTRSLFQLAREIRPDVLHAHSPALNAIAALRVGRALGIPVLYEVRAFWEDAAADHGTSPSGGLRYRMTRALETYALRRVGAVTTICHGLREDICARGIADHMVTVVPNAVDLRSFSPIDARTEEPAAGFGPGTGLPPVLGPAAVLRSALGLGGKTVIGFIGSFYAYEGLALLLQAMPQMLAAYPALSLLLVGGGPQEDALKALTASLGIEKSIVFTGRVPHDEVPRYYQIIDILVYPRLPMRLTELVTPLKPLEAMAYGRLVVASDVGGHREMIEHGKTGVLFEAGERDALAAAVLNLLGTRNRWPALRAAARAYVERERSWSGSVANYAPVYARLCAATPAPQA
jgi:PEP-CTERM/exosortase A-associated glycosyltransferase